MKNDKLYMIWVGMFILCAILGFIPEPEGLLKALLVLSAALFFVPGGILVCRAAKAGDRKTLSAVRNLSALSLGATLVLLVINLMSVTAAEVVGDLLYGLLVIVSAPMVCSRYWAASMFAWACLLFVSLSQLSRIKKQRT